MEIARMWLSSFALANRCMYLLPLHLFVFVLSLGFRSLTHLNSVPSFYLWTRILPPGTSYEVFTVRDAVVIRRLFFSLATLASSRRALLWQHVHPLVRSGLGSSTSLLYFLCLDRVLACYRNSSSNKDNLALLRKGMLLIRSRPLTQTRSQLPL